MLVGGGLLVVLQTVVRASIVYRSYYLHDDFLHLEMARRLGLSHDFLVRDYGGHLEVGQYFLYWLIGRHGGLSFAPAATSLVILQVLASCLLLAVLRVLFGRSPWLLLPFAGYLFTPLGLTVATWWAAGLQAMPLQIAMLLTLLGVVLAIRRQSWGWAVVAVVGDALGLLFWEKAVLILPTALAVLVLVEWGREPLLRRLRRLVGHWRVLLPHIVLLAAYAGAYLAVVDGSSVVGQQVRDVGRNTVDSVFRMLVPGIFGGPWSEAGTVSTIYPYVGNVLATFFVLLLLAVVAASVWLRGPRALQTWLLVAGYVAVDVTLLQVGRADFIVLLSRDPRYITDALPVIAIGMCAAFTGPRVARRAPRWFPQAVSAADSPLGAIAVLVSSCLLTTFLIDGVLEHEYSRNYVHDLVAALDENPNASVISSPVPKEVSVSTDHEGLLRAVGHELEFDQPSTDMKVVDGFGALHPVMVTGPTWTATGPVDNCGWLVTGAAQLLGSLPSSATDPQVLNLGYVTGQEATLHVAVGGYEQAVAVPIGVGHATFVVTGWHGAVRAWLTDVATGGICVTDVAAGTPWPAG
jgi:hypothetical protein